MTDPRHCVKADAVKGEHLRPFPFGLTTSRLYSSKYAE